MNSKYVCSAEPCFTLCSTYLLASDRVLSSEEKAEEASVQYVRKVFLVSLQQCNNYFCGISKVVFLLVGESQALIEAVKWVISAPDE